MQPIPADSQLILKGVHSFRTLPEKFEECEFKRSSSLERLRSTQLSHIQDELEKIDSQHSRENSSVCLTDYFMNDPYGCSPVNIRLSSEK